MKHLLRLLALVWLCVVFLPHTLWGQDALFSQYFANPLYLNPALTGYYGGTSVSLNLQQQRYKVGPFQAQSFSASMDIPCIQSAVGVLYDGNRQGDGPLFWNSVGLSYAWYALPRRQAMYNWDLRLGLRSTYNWMGLDTDNLIFSDQLDAIYGVVQGSGVDLSTFGGNMSYFDLDLGADYWVQPDKFPMIIHAGFATQHLVKADRTILNLEDTLSNRFTAYLNGVIEIGYDERRIYWIVPMLKFDTQRASGLVSQDPSFWFRRISYGVLFALQQRKNTQKDMVAPWGGLLLNTRNAIPDNRNINSLSMIAGLTWGDVTSYRLGASYDLDFSGITSDGGPTFELSLNMAFSGATLFCPNPSKRLQRRCPVPFMPSSGFASSPRGSLKLR
ncbi:MAG: hypothetical protein OHK0039_25450 [Bacteroidia bacterium]